MADNTDRSIGNSSGAFGPAPAPGRVRSVIGIVALIALIVATAAIVIHLQRSVQDARDEAHCSTICMKPACA